MFTPLIAAGCFTRPPRLDELTGAHRTWAEARADSTIVQSAATVAASAPAAQDRWDGPPANFLAHLEQKLGLGAEEALSLLGDALLCYEPKQRR